MNKAGGVFGWPACTARALKEARSRNNLFCCYAIEIKLWQFWERLLRKVCFKRHQRISPAVYCEVVNRHWFQYTRELFEVKAIILAWTVQIYGVGVFSLYVFEEKIHRSMTDVGLIMAWIISCTVASKKSCACKSLIGWILEIAMKQVEALQEMHLDALRRHAKFNII